LPHRLDQHVAALAAIAAIGAAEFDVLLAAEGDDAVAAVSGLQVDLGFVEEFHDPLPGVQGTDLRPAEPPNGGRRMCGEAKPAEAGAGD
jgi:hypothetical protein